ncbi:hypothetical protein GOV03_00040 [Candidatus Woesearchaeota archaeon]|nr:hypothetical protein [Candidatus Woesearchaeota archaeon]
MKTLNTIMVGLLSAALWCGGCVKSIKPEDYQFQWKGSYSQDIDYNGVMDEVEIEFNIDGERRSKKTKIDLGRTGIINYAREIGYDARIEMIFDFLHLYDKNGREIAYSYPNFAPFERYILIDEYSFISP